MDLAPIRLSNAAVALEPIAERHRGEVKDAAAAGGTWTYMPAAPLGDAFAPWFDAALKEHAEGREIAYIVRSLSDGAVAGSTRFLNIVPAHKRCEIGHTWYVPRYQGTKINPSTKHLLLAHAFRAGAIRVELKCDARNARSRAAILKLGAREEGTLRKHMIMHDGHVRDTVYFSILAAEWPDVDRALSARIAAT